jgi:cellulose synthase/poly-beta-1,6-N-acetylglucosamine synthase-like glycosyltransferase
MIILVLGIVLAIVLLSLYSLICLSFLPKAFALPPITSTDEELPRISIVVPTFNEEEIISNKLNDLMAVNYPSDKLEIIVVDSSTDRTAGLVSAHAGRFHLRLIREEERRGEATALNLGYSSAKGEIVVKSDCDATSDDTQLLRKLVSHFNDTRIGGVSCLYTSSYESRTESGYRGILQRLQCGESAVDSTVIAHGPFVGFRKNLLRPISPDSAADDTELFVAVRRRGYRCVVDERIIFKEIRPANTKEALAQRSRRAHGIMRVLFSNIDLLFNRTYGKYGMMIFPSNLFMLAISPTLLTATGILLAVGAVLEYSAFGVTLVGLTVFSFAVMLRSERPKAIVAFLRAQEAALVGLVMFLSRKPKHIWEKAR